MFNIPMYACVITEYRNTEYMALHCKHFHNVSFLREKHILGETLFRKGKYSKSTL